MKKHRYISKILVLIFTVLTITNIAFIKKVEARQEVNRYYSENPFDITQKVVVLTFDDGPSSISTNNILNILEENKVKASFFVVGKNIELNKDVADRMFNLNMDIYPHTNSHEYKYIYNKEENYFKDLNQCVECINNVVDGNEKMEFVRLPGGSDNRVGNSIVLERIKSLLKNRCIYYVDWNVDSTDAMNNHRTKSEIVNSIKTYGGKYKIEIVLMHDTNTKKETVASLQDIISFYKEKGYTFKKLEDLNDFELSYLIRNKIIYR